MKKIIIFGIISLTVLVNSCRKPKGNGYCTWASKTTCLNVFVNDEKDTCNFDSLEIILKFDTKYITNSPPCGSFNDSVIGNIQKIDVYVNYFINNDTITENINDIIKFKIKYFNNEILTNDLEYLNNSHPRCNNYIYLYLTNKTDTNCLQSFTIRYKETGNIVYEASSKPLYIN